MVPWQHCLANSDTPTPKTLGLTCTQNASDVREQTSTDDSVSLEHARHSARAVVSLPPNTSCIEIENYATRSVTTTAAHLTLSKATVGLISSSMLCLIDTPAPSQKVPSADTRAQKYTDFPVARERERESMPHHSTGQSKDNRDITAERAPQTAQAAAAAAAAAPVLCVSVIFSPRIAVRTMLLSPQQVTTEPWSPTTRPFLLNRIRLRLLVRQFLSRCNTVQCLKQYRRTNLRCLYLALLVCGAHARSPRQLVLALFPPSPATPETTRFLPHCRWSCCREFTDDTLERLQTLLNDAPFGRGEVQTTSTVHPTLSLSLSLTVSVLVPLIGCSGRAPESHHQQELIRRIDQGVHRLRAHGARATMHVRQKLAQGNDKVAGESKLEPVPCRAMPCRRRQHIWSRAKGRERSSTQTKGYCTHESNARNARR